MPIGTICALSGHKMAKRWNSALPCCAAKYLFLVARILHRRCMPGRDARREFSA